MSEYIPIYLDGETKNTVASAVITGGQVLYVSGTGTGAPTTAATSAVLGVASNNAAVGDPVPYFSGGQQEVVASGAITAGARVEAAAAGKVAAHTNGTNDYNSIGTAVTTAADGALVRVNFDH